MFTKEILNQNIIKLLGIEALPEERKAVLLESVSNLIQKRIMLRVMDKLKDEDKEEMIKIENNEEKAAEFIASKVPNLEQIMQEEVIKAKADLLESLPKE
jgi:hypothetical protein